MKTLAAIVLAALVLGPVSTAAQATNLTGDWNATFTRTAPDGRTQTITFTFHFTQKGKVLKGVVDGDKVTFQVQQTDGPLRSFALTHAKDRLQGTQKLEFKGQTAEVTVDAERAKSK
jgi:hypothetical protein